MPDFSHLRLKRLIAFSKDSSSLTWTRGTNFHPLLRGFGRPAMLPRGPGCVNEMLCAQRLSFLSPRSRGPGRIVPRASQTRRRRDSFLNLSFLGVPAEAGGGRQGSRGLEYAWSQVVLRKRFSR